MPSVRLLTPVVAAPNRAKPSQEAATELSSPIVLVSPFGDFEFETGEILIGRSIEADVPLDDLLVSRIHARILLLPDGGVVVEDLRSSNGVFVNSQRINERSARLNAGDRLLMGTTEMSLFSASSSGKIRIAPLGPAASLQVRAPSPVVSSVHAEPPVFFSSSTELTDRSDAFAMIDRLADRFLTSQRKPEAVRLLSEHLWAISQKVSVDLPLPGLVLDRATDQALKLFGWTGGAEWIAYVLELHAKCRHLLKDEHFQALLDAMHTVGPAVNGEVLAHYIECLSAQSPAMTSEERLRFNRQALLGVPG